MSCFSDRLRSLRQNFGLSQQKLADAIGSISKSSINMYERGDREPGLETMEAFADFFNVDLDYLYGKSDIPNRSQVSGVVPRDNQIVLSAHERSLILAYRSHPDAQPFVDKLLGVEPEPAAMPKQA